VGTLQREGWSLYYEEHGTGVPLLGVHGSPSSAVFWEDAGRELARVGHCILYDRRGYHRSGPPRSSSTDLDQEIDDAAELLEQVAGAPAVVIGRSTGGLIALALAMRRPDLVRGLVLLEPAVFTLDRQAQRWADGLRTALLAAGNGGDPATASRSVLDMALGPGTWEGLDPTSREIFAGAGSALLAEVRGRGLDLSADPFAPTPEELARVDLPVLVVSAASSYEAARAVDDRLVGLLPRARHAVVPGGHVIHPAHPVVLEFLAEVLGPAQPSDGARS
jgi:pimeloyl-ACP methyl ester carboxylesterase